MDIDQSKLLIVRSESDKKVFISLISAIKNEINTRNSLFDTTEKIKFKIFENDGEDEND